MENKEKHIDHWLNGAVDIIETDEILLEKKKLSFALFFCHLAIEKLLKAFYIKTNNDFPPKTHKLLLLLDKSGITLTNSQKLFMSSLMQYQLEGRYPEILTEVIEFEKPQKIFNNSRDLLKWLMETLEAQ